MALVLRDALHGRGDVVGDRKLMWQKLQRCLHVGLAVMSSLLEPRKNAANSDKTFAFNSYII